MKRYGQACAIARALDVVGERWSLLLVRELTLGPRRYRDLATGLPGIPSNVLAGRLKDLQAAGVITRRTLPAPTDDAGVTMPADPLYSLVPGQTTVPDAVRHSTVDGDTEIARRALEPLAATRTRPAPAI